MIDFGKPQDARWYAKDVRGEEHKRLMPVFQRLRLQDAPRREACLRRMRMYGNYALWSTTQVAMPNDRLRYNVGKQCVDTLLAEITSSKPKATFLVDGGDWTLRQSAKACDNLIEAQMRDNGIYDGLGRAWCKDAEITGTGILYDYVDRETLTPKVERVLPLELLVDEADARYGRPRSIYRQRVVDRGVLLDRYQDDEAKARMIREAPRFSPLGFEEWLLRDAGESDLILVVEAWHLKSGKNADDGRYVVAIEKATLESDEYDDCDFPFTVLNWEDAPIGFWGVGVMEQVESDQVELNRTLRRIQDAAGVAAGVWLVHKGGRLRAVQFTDVPGAVIEHSGIPPQYQVPPTIPQDLLQHADRIIARCLQRLGISEAFANAIKPVGLDSGEAQRVHSDIYSRRQVEHSQRWDSAHVALAKRLVKRNHEIYELIKSGKNEDDDVKALRVSVKVKRGRKTVLKKIRWDEAALPENEYVLSAYPTSSLPSEPSGRAALLAEWIKGGLIDQQTARAMQDLPDIDGALNLEMADYNYALYCYETMLEDGVYVPPDPYQNLQIALELIRRSYLCAMIDGAPEDRLDLIRDHMEAIKALIAKASKPTPAAPMATPVADPTLQTDPSAVPAPEMAGVDPSTLQVAA